MQLEIFKGKKVLITGHSGFKGSWLIALLNLAGAKVYGYSINIPTKPSLYEIIMNDCLLEDKFADICDHDQFKDYLEYVKPDFIFHLAAQSIVSKSFQNSYETFMTNVMGMCCVLDNLKEYKHNCIAVLITSDKSYKNNEWVWGYRETDELGGKDPYSGSKGAAELVFHSYFESFFSNDEKVKLGVGRAGNVIGGGDWAVDRIVVDCFKSWSKNKPVTLRSPSATRPWQHVLEPLSGYISLASNLYEGKICSGEAFNFGPDASMNYTVGELVESLSEKWAGEKLQRYYVVENEIKINEAKLLKLNCDKALSKLNWKPTLNYEETLNFVGSWYNKFFNENCNMSEYTNLQIQEYIKLRE